MQKERKISADIKRRGKRGMRGGIGKERKEKEEIDGMTAEGRECIEERRKRKGNKYTEKGRKKKEKGGQCSVVERGRKRGLNHEGREKGQGM